MRFEQHWLGLVDYKRAEVLQQDAAKSPLVNRGFAGQILGLEHPSVITAGRALATSPWVQSESLEVPVVAVERGGLLTLHSPGQLVIYPIMRLPPGFGVKAWVELLLEVTQSTLAEVGVRADSRDQTGLWTEKGKIAFLGLRIKDRVSTHGLSINVHNDLDLFSLIEACGVRHAVIDRIAHHRSDVGTRDFFELWAREFRRRACQIFPEQL